MKQEDKTIKIACSGTDFAGIKELKNFQGKIKSISDINLEKLKTRIKNSFDFPFFVWVNSEGEKKIIDGHQRRKAILSLLVGVLQWILIQPILMLQFLDGRILRIKRLLDYIQI